MPDLRRRATDPEILDGALGEAEARRSLADLRLANRLLGGRHALRRAIRPLLPHCATLLDVGCGSGDLPAWLVTRSGGRLSAFGLDRKLAHARETPPEVIPLVGDVRALPFRDGAFDVVTASLFLHHFDAHELPRVLAELFRVARRGLVINDLRRALVPLCFGRIAFPLLFQSAVSVADGLLSIRRGFRQQELQTAFLEAGLGSPRIRRCLAYRLVATVERKDAVATPSNAG
jgi:SAM-dependent methyltransferase